MKPIFHPHEHRCKECGKAYTATKVWDRQDYGMLGECACEEFVCQECADKLVVTDVEL